MGRSSSSQLQKPWIVLMWLRSSWLTPSSNRLRSSPFAARRAASISLRRRIFNSPAAFSVNVIATICSIVALPVRTACKMRSMASVVLPVPADASTRKVVSSSRMARSRAAWSIGRLLIFVRRFFQQALQLLPYRIGLLDLHQLLQRRLGERHSGDIGHAVRQKESSFADRRLDLQHDFLQARLRARELFACPSHSLQPSTPCHIEIVAVAHGLLRAYFQGEHVERNLQRAALVKARGLERLAARLVIVHAPRTAAYGGIDAVGTTLDRHAEHAHDRKWVFDLMRHVITVLRLDIEPCLEFGERFLPANFPENC